MTRQTARLVTNRQRSPRTIAPLTAIGALLVLIAVTALITYAALTLPGMLLAKGGPPEEFLVAATRQAERTRAAGLTRTPTGTAMPAASPGASTPTAGSSSETGIPSAVPPSPLPNAATSTPRTRPTANPFGEWPLPDWVDERYWLSVPAIELEAPIIALSPRAQEVDGLPVLRLPVPNSYAVSWDQNSAEPGFAGNTILTGHSNLYGGVFSELDRLTYGAEIAIWSEYGVFSYYVSVVEYMEENGQPLEVRRQNAQWLSDSADDRVTLITCWPTSNSSHRLIVVGTR